MRSTIMMMLLPANWARSISWLCRGQDTRKIYSMASAELRSLNENSEELKNTLSEHPDERVQAAIIRNYQMKEKVMERSDRPNEKTIIN